MWQWPNALPIIFRGLLYICYIAVILYGRVLQLLLPVFCVILWMRIMK